MKKLWSLPLLCGFASVSLVACDDSSSFPDAMDEGTEEIVDDELVPVSVPLMTYPHRTTSPEIALRNLDATIESDETRWARLGGLDAVERLVAHLDLRAQVVGTVDDYTRALEVSEAVLDATDADSLLLHAEVLSALHRYEEALDVLDSAAALGADVVSAQDAVRIAQGQGLDMALQRRLAAAEAFPSYETWTDLATVYVAIGEYDAADAAFVEALRGYDDVSPFAVAWIQFQRGVLWGEAVGRADLAEAFYRDAIRLMPDYLVAQVHLAELEAENGDEASAIQRLQAVGEAGDPEPWSRLAEYLVGAPAEADAARAEALARYERLLGLHELAFADHAAEFFLGSGDDAERGYALAQANLANRETDRAYELAIDAALATGRDAEACSLLVEAGADRHRVGLVEFRETLACE